MRIKPRKQFPPVMFRKSVLYTFNGYQPHNSPLQVVSLKISTHVWLIDLSIFMKLVEISMIINIHFSTPSMTNCREKVELHLKYVFCAFKG